MDKRLFASLLVILLASVLYLIPDPGITCGLSVLTTVFGGVATLGCWFNYDKNSETSKISGYTTFSFAIMMVGLANIVIVYLAIN